MKNNWSSTIRVQTKQHKSDEEYSDSAERASLRGTSRGKRRGARGARGVGELRRS